MGYTTNGGRGYLSGFGAIVGASVAVTGAVTGASAAIAGDIVATGTGAKIEVVGTGATFRGPAGTAAAPTYTFTADLDTGLANVNANLVQTCGGGAYGIEVGGGVASVNGTFVTSLILFTETTAPSGVNNQAKLYAIDVAGKTALTVVAGVAGVPSAANTVAGYIALDP